MDWSLMHKPEALVLVEVHQAGTPDWSEVVVQLVQVVELAEGLVDSQEQFANVVCYLAGPQQHRQ